jgi:hypothetical protein
MIIFKRAIILMVNLITHGN